jgi:hypothetical protein
MPHDLGPLPLVHPRQEPVERARRELAGWVIDFAKRHDLTLAEELSLLAELLHDKLARCVRSERRESED